MAFDELFAAPGGAAFETKNTELKSLAEFSYEICTTTSKEQCGGTTMGIDEHCATRQRQYLENVATRLDGLAERPLPDLPASHPMLFQVTPTIPDFMTDANGNVVNHDVEVLATMWARFGYELLMSNSSGLGGGLTSFDYSRAQQNIEAIEQVLDGLIEAGEVDFPETASPAAMPAKKTRR